MSNFTDFFPAPSATIESGTTAQRPASPSSGVARFNTDTKKYEIEIVDGLNFTASKYFDIRSNSWKLDKLIPSVLEANKLCREFSHKKL